MSEVDIVNRHCHCERVILTNMTLNEKLITQIESLRPEQALTIECKSKEQAKSLLSAIRKWVSKETHSGVLPYDYAVVMQRRFTPIGYLVVVRCYERPVVRKLERRDEGWEILEEEVL